jgi:hypothetical protein
MRVPFQNELDEVFRSNRSIWLKIGGCSLVSIFIVLTGTFRFARQSSIQIQLSTSLLVILSLISGVLGAILGLMLALKDTIDHRLDRGDSINPILRLFFGSGKQSLLVWFVSILFAAFVVTVVGASLGLF